MELIVFEKEAYYRMMSELASMVKQAVKEAKEEILNEASPENDWLDTEAAKTLLNIKSKSTMQKLRDSGSIKFCQFGRKIRYSRKSILEFLNKNIPKW